MSCCDALEAECPLDLTEDDCRTLIGLLLHAITTHGEPQSSKLEPSTAASSARSSGRLRNICVDPNFLWIAALWACAIGTAWAIQGMCAGR